jgi:ribulose-phosphate 3-epimerase
MSSSSEAYRIAPSILSADFTRLGDELAAVEAGGADWIHIDVMDGQFVPNITVGPMIVAACSRATGLFLDVHLMIETPERLLAEFVEAGAQSITVHLEASPHIHRTLQQIRALGCRAGVAINPGTPASAIDPVLHLADLALVMSVNPGFPAQEFLPEVLPKVASIRQKAASWGLELLVEMDGGISEKTVSTARKAGCQVFVAGSAVFKHPDGPETGVTTLRSALSG